MQTWTVSMALALFLLFFVASDVVAEKRPAGCADTVQPWEPGTIRIEDEREATDRGVRVLRNAAEAQECFIV